MIGDIRSYRRRYGRIDLRRPINPEHPLNTGRVAWWLTVPGWYGGSQWYDLCGLNPGTLTNMGNSTNGWRTQSNKGGYGSVLFDGTAGYVSPGQIPALVITGPLTVYAWIIPLSLPTGLGVGLSSIVTTGYDGTSQDYDLRIGTGSTNNLFFGTYNSTGGAHGVTGRLFTSADLGKPFLVGGSWDGATWKTWVNGVVDASASDSQGPYSSSCPFGIGGAYIISSFTFQPRFFNGYISDAGVIGGRAWSASEWQTYYILSQQGYPGVLNRVSSMLPKFYSFGGGGSFTQSVSDSLTLSASASANNAATGSLSASVTLSASAAAVGKSFPSLSDSITLSASISSKLAASRSISDSITMSDSAAAIMAAAAAVADSLHLSDSASFAGESAVAFRRPSSALGARVGSRQTIG